MGIKNCSNILWKKTFENKWNKIEKKEWVKNWIRILRNLSKIRRSNEWKRSSAVFWQIFKKRKRIGLGFLCMKTYEQWADMYSWSSLPFYTLRNSYFVWDLIIMDFLKNFSEGPSIIKDFLKNFSVVSSRLRSWIFKRFFWGIIQALIMIF